jgi:pimeloyl-ACP methyl ester carboxylesterase
MNRRLLASALVVLVAALLVWVAETQVPGAAAGGLLHPARRVSQQRTPVNCQAITFHGVDVALSGWSCLAGQARKGTVVYLHGIADNRSSAIGVIERYTTKGYDVIAYDSRAHGESEGAACTYGYFEKHDLIRVLDEIEPQPVAIVGTSLGAAVALQAASYDQRISVVVAAETFSDLRTIASERAPWILPDSLVADAFQVAERIGQFNVDAVSPFKAASKIRIPVLLIHGAADRDTPPSHSQRVLSALAGPKRLLLVEGAGHNESLRQEDTWRDIDRWIEQAMTQR